MSAVTRARSFWGWGWEDRFPDAQGRRNLASLVGAMLGIEGLEPRDPPVLGQVKLPSPRLAVPASLSSFCTQDRAERARHCWGRAWPDLWRGFHGDFHKAPDIVALPRDEEQIQRAMAWCARQRVALIPYGGGTSVTGGVEPDVSSRWRGVMSLDLRHMDKLLAVDPLSRTATLEAGVAGPALEAALGEHGLTLRHFPQSFEFSTLGGWVATRAGGHFATVYTHIDDLVAGLRMVTPAGVVETPAFPGSGAGPDPNRLVLGSEGALGVITQATVRVRPRPDQRARASVRFADFQAALAATRQIAQSGLHPSNCRLLDAREAALHSVVSDGSHVLLLGFEAHGWDVRGAMEQALGLALAHGGVCPEGISSQREASSDTWKQAFLEMPYLLGSLVSLGLLADTFETACTWSQFEALHADLVREVRAALKASGGSAWLSCRFTHVYPDGPAPYYTFITRADPEDAVGQWRAIKAVASEVLLRHGATITHHHAVGRTHQPWYLRQSPALFTQALAQVKGRLDPTGMLNPGVLLPEK